jgi:hypothetical protein
MNLVSMSIIHSPRPISRIQFNEVDANCEMKDELYHHLATPHTLVDRQPIRPGAPTPRESSPLSDSDSASVPVYNPRHTIGILGSRTRDPRSLQCSPSDESLSCNREDDDDEILIERNNEELRKHISPFPSEWIILTSDIDHALAGLTTAFLAWQDPENWLAANKLHILASLDQLIPLSDHDEPDWAIVCDTIVNQVSYLLHAPFISLTLPNISPASHQLHVHTFETLWEEHEVQA